MTKINLLAYFHQQEEFELRPGEVTDCSLWSSHQVLNCNFYLTTTSTSKKDDHVQGTFDAQTQHDREADIRSPCREPIHLTAAKSKTRNIQARL